VTSVIIGAKSMDQLRDNVASTRVRLDDAEMKQLDEISALPPEYPEWMIAYQGQARLKVPVKE
jgi:aryl-alcohol dehydrogenase-like predicted oxidoreductase